MKTTTPLRSKQDALNLADQLADSLVELKQIKANETAELNQIKGNYKPDLTAATKSRDGLKRRLSNWVTKHARLLFDAPTGTVRSSKLEISLRNNPPAIKPIDPTADETDLINLAIELGYQDVITTVQSINKDVLATLSNEELSKLGFQRVQTTTTSFKLLVDKSESASAKSSS